MSDTVTCLNARFKPGSARFGSRRRRCATANDIRSSSAGSSLFKTPHSTPVLTPAPGAVLTARFAGLVPSKSAKSDLGSSSATAAHDANGPFTEYLRKIVEIPALLQRGPHELLDFEGEKAFFSSVFDVTREVEAEWRARQAQRRLAGAMANYRPISQTQPSSASSVRFRSADSLFCLYVPRCSPTQIPTLNPSSTCLRGTRA